MSAELSHGVSVVSHQVHTDMRGDFREWFSTRNLPDGWQSFTLAQANLSVSVKGVIRGIHFSRSDVSQRKIVTCVRGEILEFVVDLRVGSPTFGSHVPILLKADSGKSIFIENGMGHGFQALSKEAVIVYLTDLNYDPGLEESVNPFDKRLAIPWRELEHNISDRDNKSVTLDQLLASNKLPRFAE